MTINNYPSFTTCRSSCNEPGGTGLINSQECSHELSYLTVASVSCTCVLAFGSTFPCACNKRWSESTKSIPPSELADAMAETSSPSRVRTSDSIRGESVACFRLGAQWLIAATHRSQTASARITLYMRRQPTSGSCDVNI